MKNQPPTNIAKSMTFPKVVYQQLINWKLYKELNMAQTGNYMITFTKHALLRNRFYGT